MEAVCKCKCLCWMKVWYDSEFFSIVCILTKSAKDTGFPLGKYSLARFDLGNNLTQSEVVGHVTGVTTEEVLKLAQFI